MLRLSVWFVGSLTSLCHSNRHIETMPAWEINPFTALTRIRSQFLRTQWSTSNHQRVDMTTPQTDQPSGLALRLSDGLLRLSYGGQRCEVNKETRSPEIFRQQVQKLTPHFFVYNGYRFPLSLSTIWGNHLPVNFMLKFPTCISTIWRNNLPYLTNKWRGTFQYFQSHDKIPYIYYLEKPPPFNQ